MLYLARVEFRRAGDVSPLILRKANNQGNDIPRSPNKRDSLNHDLDLNPIFVCRSIRIKSSDVSKTRF